MLTGDVCSKPLPFLIGSPVILLLNCESSLYILHTRPLSDMRFANMFSHSVRCLFTLLIVLFDAQKFLILTKSIYLLIFLIFHFVLLMLYLRIHCQIQGQEYNFGYGWYGSGDWAPACEPKGHWFDSQSGHMPGLQARSPVRGCEKQLIDVSLPLPKNN